jgi:hypothetical protein
LIRSISGKVIFTTLKNKSLLYSVHTETFDPESVEILAHEYGLLIVNDMSKKAAIKIIRVHIVNDREQGYFIAGENLYFHVIY